MRSSLLKTSIVGATVCICFVAAAAPALAGKYLIYRDGKLSRIDTHSLKRAEIMKWRNIARERSEHSEKEAHNAEAFDWMLEEAPTEFAAARPEDETPTALRRFAADYGVGADAVVGHGSVVSSARPQTPVEQAFAKRPVFHVPPRPAVQAANLSELPRPFTQPPKPAGLPRPFTPAPPAGLPRPVVPAPKPSLQPIQLTTPESIEKIRTQIVQLYEEKQPARAARLLIPNHGVLVRTGHSFKNLKIDDWLHATGLVIWSESINVRKGGVHAEADAILRCSYKLLETAYDQRLTAEQKHQLSSIVLIEAKASRARAAKQTPTAFPPPKMRSVEPPNLPAKLNLAFQTIWLEIVRGSPPETVYASCFRSGLASTELTQLVRALAERAPVDLTAYIVSRFMLDNAIRARMENQHDAAARAFGVSRGLALLQFDSRLSDELKIQKHLEVLKQFKVEALFNPSLDAVSRSDTEILELYSSNSPRNAYGALERRLWMNGVIFKGPFDKLPLDAKLHALGQFARLAVMASRLNGDVDKAERARDIADRCLKAAYDDRVSEADKEVLLKSSKILTGNGALNLSQLRAALAQSEINTQPDHNLPATLARGVGAICDVFTKGNLAAGYAALNSSKLTRADRERVFSAVIARLPVNLQIYLYGRKLLDQAIAFRLAKKHESAQQLLDLSSVLLEQEFARNSDETKLAVLDEIRRDAVAKEALGLSDTPADSAPKPASTPAPLDSLSFQLPDDIAAKPAEEQQTFDATSLLSNLPTEQPSSPLSPLLSGLPEDWLLSDNEQDDPSSKKRLASDDEQSDREYKRAREQVIELD